MSTKNVQKTANGEKISAPIIEFMAAGQIVATYNIVTEFRNGNIYIYHEVIPVTRVKGGLPDWPQALSLKPDPSTRTN